jgi:CRP/FNR family transcriptional regulator, cyclic AMP receptor protein
MSNNKHHFSGTAGRRGLVEALKHQRVVAGNEELAEAIADSGEVLEVERGAALIDQGNDDTHVYLIVEGAFHIVVNGKPLARRVANDHVGEMAAILPVQRRAASVIAEQPSVVVKLTEAAIEKLGNRYAQIWRCFARELAHRVTQRNTLATGVSESVRVLIISSGAAARFAHGIESALADEKLAVTVLTDGIFKGAGHTIDHLENMVDQCDVAITVAEPDDPAGNIIFELGFLMGRLGRHRTFLIEPRGEEIKLPPALAGINTIHYKYGDGQNPRHALAAACARLRNSIRDLGPNR